MARRYISLFDLARLLDFRILWYRRYFPRIPKYNHRTNADTSVYSVDSSILQSNFYTVERTYLVHHLGGNMDT